MHAPENRSWNPAGTGTLLDPCWNLTEILLRLLGALLKPRWNLAGTLQEPGDTLLEPRWNPLAGNPGWNIFLGTNAGVDFVFLVKLFLALLNEPGCDVGSLAWICWNRFATLLEPIWRQLLDFLWVLFCFFLFWSCGRPKKRRRSLAETVVLGFLPEPLKEPFAGTLAWTFGLNLWETVCWSPCRNALNVSGCFMCHYILEPWNPEKPGTIDPGILEPWNPETLQS